jgi:thermitase
VYNPLGHPWLFAAFTLVIATVLSVPTRAAADPTPPEPLSITEVEASELLAAPLIVGVDGTYRSGQLVLLVDEVFDTGVLRELSASVELLRDTPSPHRGIRLLHVRVEESDSDGLLSLLAGRSDVVAAERNYVGEVQLVPNDPLWTNQAALGAGLLNMPLVWDRWRGRFGTRVAIVDTGVNPVSELFGRVVGGRNVLIGGDPEDTSDDAGHGTQVASIVASSLNNGTGVAGIAPNVGIVPVKACYPYGSLGQCDSMIVAAGLQWIDNNKTTMNIQVVNMSFRTDTFDSHTVNAFINFLNDDGVILVGAAGNDGINGVFYPANQQNVIAVGGATANGGRHPDSNYGNDLDFAAPMCTWTITAGGTPVQGCATSFAAPVISGLAALFKSHAIVEMSGPSWFYGALGSSGWNPQVGNGVPTEFWKTAAKADCRKIDFNGDLSLDVLDRQTIAFRYGRDLGHPLYHPKYDVEPFLAADNDIDIKDLQFVFPRTFFMHCPP